jgi:hypothetical protein
MRGTDERVAEVAPEVGVLFQHDDPIGEQQS